MNHMFKLLVFVAVVTMSVPAFAESPLTIEGATTIKAAQAKALFDKEILFVDVRKNSDWEAGRVPGAEHLELHKVFTEKSLAALVKKDVPVVFYCNGTECMRSSEATTAAVGWGYTKVHYFRGGFPAWKQAGYPVE